jgi:ribonuclease BN (tRNA processing enzyme)
MKLVVLGSGTSVPHAKRASPAFWLETNSGSILLDISADAPHRMAQEGLDWTNLGAIWISHFHLDHMGGLAPYLFGTKWAPQTQDRTRPLKIFGPCGLRDLFAAIDDANNYRLLSQPFEIELVEVRPGSTFHILPNIVAKTIATPHTKESLALHLMESPSKSLVYTSDTGFSEELAPFAKDVDLLLMECSFRRNKPLQTHLELAEAIGLARAAAPKKLLLTHLYPQWDCIDLVSEARLLWSGETLEATDGLRLEI